MNLICQNCSDEKTRHWTYQRSVLFDCAEGHRRPYRSDPASQADTEELWMLRYDSKGMHHSISLITFRGSLSLKRCHLNDSSLDWWRFQTNYRAVINKWKTALWLHSSTWLLSKNLRTQSSALVKGGGGGGRTGENQSYRQPMQDPVCNVDLWCWTGPIEAAECVLVHHNLRQMDKVG